MPWDMVRLPCGSMSQHRTRWPSSAKATARLSVVVVLATPPFWLANAITLQVAVTGVSDAWGNSYAACIRRPGRNPSAGGPASVFCEPVSALLKRRLIFVTGKGGVGKSTVATALGLLAARRGLRTIVAELASQDHVQRAFDTTARISARSSSPRGCSRSRSIPSTRWTSTCGSRPARSATRSARRKIFQAFAMATPGMRELLSIGKVWELAQLERQTQAPRRTTWSSSTRPRPATASASCARRARSPRSRGSARSRARPAGSPPRSPTASSPPWWRSPRRRRCPSTRRWCSTTRSREDDLGLDAVDRQRAAIRSASSTPRWRQLAKARRRTDIPARRAARCGRRCPSTTEPRPSDEQLRAGSRRTLDVPTDRASLRVRGRARRATQLRTIAERPQEELT